MAPLHLEALSDLSNEETDAQTASGDERNRREHERLAAHELEWLKSIKLKFGPSVSLIDLSPGGALIESTTPLRPGSTATLTIAGKGGLTETATLRVLRCEVASLAQGLVYRGACVFDRKLTLPEPTPSRRQQKSSRKNLAETKQDELLRSIQNIATKADGSSAEPSVASLLAEIAGALRRGDSHDAVLEFIEGRLTPPPDAPATPTTPPAKAPTLRLVHRSDAGSASAPPIAEPRPTRVRAATPPAPVPVLTPTPTPKVCEPVVQDPPSAPDANAAANGWNKLVVRYLDGKLLKGFSQDFHPSRPHFHLSQSLDGATQPPVLVPMPQLKAVFFVREFAGDADYVERKSFVEPLPGRRIEITYLDGEVMIGATLGYRPDGTGFFITPADTNGNNLRVFVLPGAVRHIRYL